MVRILVIGDVVSKEGCAFLRERLPEIKRRYQVGIVIANGENSAVGNGILPGSADYLFSSGVDIITCLLYTSTTAETSSPAVMLFTALLI